MTPDIPYSDLPPGVSLRDIEPRHLCESCDFYYTEDDHEFCKHCEKEIAKEDAI